MCYARHGAPVVWRADQPVSQSDNWWLLSSTWVESTSISCKMPPLRSDSSVRTCVVCRRKPARRSWQWRWRSLHVVRNQAAGLFTLPRRRCWCPPPFCWRHYHVWCSHFQLDVPSVSDWLADYCCSLGDLLALNAVLRNSSQYTKI